MAYFLESTITLFPSLLAVVGENFVGEILSRLYLGFPPGLVGIGY
jgi:hypothetical protein